MAHIKNLGPCPPALSNYVQGKLTATVRKQDEPSWWRRVLSLPDLTRSGERLADVRWLSECDMASRTCSGYLLGRWVMHAGGSQLLEMDFGPNEVDWPNSGDPPAMPYGRPFHVMVYDFALSPEADQCVLVEIDLDGRVQRAAYELLNGVNSASFGPMIGDVVRERFARDKWDVCVPPGWRPRTNDESQHS